jgi:hypothetical protein
VSVVFETGRRAVNPSAGPPGEPVTRASLPESATHRAYLPLYPS